MEFHLLLTQIDYFQFFFVFSEAKYFFTYTLKTIILITKYNGIIFKPPV